MSGFIQSGRFGGAAFSPLSIAGLVAWYDSTDAATFTYSTGVQVSQWNDKSGNANHLLQGSSTLQPLRSGTINSLTTVTFDGSNDLMAPAANIMTGKTAGSIVWVSKSAGTDDQGAPCSFGDDYLNFGGQIYETFGSNTRRNYAHGVTLTAAHCFSYVAASADKRAYINGTSKYSTATNTVAWAQAFNLARKPAAANAFQGDVGEIAIYDTALSDTDRQAVEAYLKAKWGTP